jgi:hypothetical protein
MPRESAIPHIPDPPEPPAALIVTVSAAAVKVMFVPATNDLNSKSTPVFCLNRPSPAPTLEAVFASPPPPPAASIVT